MDVHTLGSFIDTEHASKPPSYPAPILHASHPSEHGLSQVPSPPTGDTSFVRIHGEVGSSPGTIREVNSCRTRSTTPPRHIQASLTLENDFGEHGESSLQLESWRTPSINKWRFLSCCFAYFVNGMNDSAPGALIPYIEKYYSIGYAVVSLVFVAQAVGFVLAAFFTDFMRSYLGQAKTFIISQLLMICSYAILASSPPFPAVVFSFLSLGVAMAVSLALNNVFCAGLASSTTIMGAGHGAYGIGGVIGPFIATSLVTRGAIWSRYYLITLGICVFTMLFLGFAFNNYHHGGSAQSTHQPTPESFNPSKLQLLGRSLKSKVTLLGALFVFAYQGAEVSISGWVISFLITVRHGDPANVGYVTAGFWGGITLGRFTLTPLCTRLGVRRSVFVLGALAIAFQLLVWLVPNVIGDAIAVALGGYVLGPVAPCSTVYFLRLLPRAVQTTAISFISSAGSSGGAVAPFFTGLLAQSVGTWVLHPVCVGLFMVMVVGWAALPRVERRVE